MKLGIFSRRQLVYSCRKKDDGTHHTVELASLVALRMSQVILCLAGAVLTEVLGSLWHDVGEQLHLDSSQGLAAEGDVEEYDRVGRCACHLIWLEFMELKSAC